MLIGLADAPGTKQLIRVCSTKKRKYILPNTSTAVKAQWCPSLKFFSLKPPRACMHNLKYENQQTKTENTSRDGESRSGCRP